MLRQFQTTILERKTTISDGFATEPIEAAWAGEALFFIQVKEPEGNKTRLQARVQISPDGIRWVDEGGVLDTAQEPGLHFIRVTHFGGWLRLCFTINPDTGSAGITAHLVLKE